MDYMDKTIFWSWPFISNYEKPKPLAYKYILDEWFASNFVASVWALSYFIMIKPWCQVHKEMVPDIAVWLH